MRTLQQILAAIDQADVFLGVPVNSVRSERFTGETALHIYAKWGDPEAIRILVANGADIDKRGEDDNTPLHYAAMLGQLAATQCLVELGAANCRDRYGNRPIDLADDHADVRKFLESSGYGP
jgi:ankyrin repeat protein